MVIHTEEKVIPDGLGLKYKMLNFKNNFQKKIKNFLPNLKIPAYGAIPNIVGIRPL